MYHLDLVTDLCAYCLRGMQYSFVWMAQVCLCASVCVWVGG